MGLKGINPFEQHVEKIVAGVFATGLLAVLTVQFVGGLKTVLVGDIKTQREVPLDEAYAVVAERAKSQENKITTETPELPKATAGQTLLERFQGSSRGPVSPRPRLATALDVGGSIGGGSLTKAASGGNPTFGAVAVPATTGLTAYEHLGTIDPREVAEAPELAKYLPKEQPYDKAAVSVEAMFDGTALKKALQTDPDGGGPAQALPMFWWDQSVQILAVQLDRQEMQPDKSWGAPAMVASMPGRLTLVPRLADGVRGAAALKDLVRLATDYAEQVRQPEYYATLFGEPWVEPRLVKAADAAGPAGDVGAARLRDELRQTDDEIARTEKALADADKDKSRGPGTGGSAVGGKGPVGRPAQPSGQPTGKPTESPRKQQIQAKLDRLEKRRSQLVDDLKALGVKVTDSGKPGMEGGQQDNAPGAPPKKPGAGKGEASLLDNPEVRVWSHDVTVERGKTYRYRVRVLVNNPFFGHLGELSPDQADLAKEPVLLSAESAWSDPVQVDDDTYFFITNAQEHDPVSKTPQTRAEVYKVNWGFYRRGTVLLEPGDKLMAEVKLPEMDKWMAAPDKPDVPPPPRDASPRDPRGVPPPPPRQGGGGKGVQPAPGPGPDPGRPRDPKEPKKEADGPTYRTVLIEHDGLLLDVASVPGAREGSGGNRSTVQAYLKESDGQVVVRIPEEERMSDLYRRVARSAARGEAAVKPELGNLPPGGPNQPDQPGVPEPKKPPKKPTGKGDDGGGGGGGG